jgi:integrase
MAVGSQQDCSLTALQLRGTFHSLRHTYASLLLQHGASLADIQAALGHTTLAMTMRYAHLLQAESASKLATIMNKVFKLCSPQGNTELCYVG